MDSDGPEPRQDKDPDLRVMIATARKALALAKEGTGNEQALGAAERLLRAVVERYRDLEEVAVTVPARAEVATLRALLAPAIHELEDVTGRKVDPALRRACDLPSA
jgi:hypothetical protein